MLGFDDVRRNLEGVDFKEGLTREEIRTQSDNLPDWALDALPPDYEFRDAGEVTAYLQRVRSEPPIDMGASGEPRLWGNSPTAGGLNVTDDGRHGVGSGADSGYTGGGSSETAADPLGTTYGDPRPDREDPDADGLTMP